MTPPPPFGILLSPPQGTPRTTNLTETMTNAKRYDRGPFYTLTRTMLGKDAAEHGYRVAENLLNDRSRRISWSMAILGQVHDWAEATDLTVAEVTKIVGDYLSGRRRDLSPTYAAVGTALHAVTRQEGEEYTDFIERVCASSSLAVRLKIADVRDNLARCHASTLRSWTTERYTSALEKLEAAEAGWLEREEQAHTIYGEDRLTGEEYAMAAGNLSENY